MSDSIRNYDVIQCMNLHNNLIRYRELYQFFRVTLLLSNLNETQYFSVSWVLGASVG